MRDTVILQLTMKPENPDALPSLHDLLSTPSFRGDLLNELAETAHRKLACDTGGNWEVDATLDAGGDVQAVEVAGCPHRDNPVFCVYCNLECGDRITRKTPTLDY